MLLLGNYKLLYAMNLNLLFFKYFHYDYMLIFKITLQITMEILQ